MGGTDNHDDSSHRSSDLSRRTVLKGVGTAGLTGIFGAGVSGSAAALEDGAAGGEPVGYQYFHADWTDIRADMDRLGALDIDAIWVQQPAEATLTRRDQEELIYGENPEYGSRVPFPPLGYQPWDFRSFDSAMGSFEELSAMIDAAHDHDVSVICDVVLNHVASNYTTPTPEWEYPQFGYEHFHDQGPVADCGGDNFDACLKTATLSGLKDLNQRLPYVREQLYDYVARIAEAGADGLRYDSANLVWQWFFRDYANQWADEFGLWRVGEVIDDTATLLEYAATGMNVFDYPLYYAIIDAFEGGDMRALAQDRARGVVHEDASVAVTFAQNHDAAGPGVGPDSPAGVELDLAHAYVLSYAGMPMLYRADLDDPALQELVWVKRNLASGTPIDRHVDADTYVFERAGNLLAGINSAGQPATRTVQTSWNDVVLTDHAGDAGDVTVGSDGTATVTVPAEDWVMYAPGGGGGGGDDGDDGGSGAPIEEGVYRITPVHSDKAVDVSDVSTADGATVHQWEYVGGDNQRWLAEHLGDGVYRLVAQHSDKVLAVDSGSTADGADVIQWTWHGGPGQRWAIEHVSGDQYRVVNVNSGKVLDVSGGSTADGANVHQWAWHGGDNQRFRLA